MRFSVRMLTTLAVALGFLLAIPPIAQAAVTISITGSATIKAARTLTVPISASCAPDGQESTFIIVTVSQGTIQKGNYVDGQGDVLSPVCDSTAHSYDVEVRASFGKTAWRPGDAALTAIISYCMRAQDGTLSCTTQAFVPAGTPIQLVRR
jgi:hypothetical protein